MNILILDTTNHDNIYVGIAKDTTIVLDLLEEWHEGIAEHLDEITQKILKKTNLKLTDIDLIIINQGPGSHTGIRMGLAFIKAISQILNIPIVGIPDSDDPKKLIIEGYKKFKVQGGDDFVKLLPIYSFS